MFRYTKDLLYAMRHAQPLFLLLHAARFVALISLAACTANTLAPVSSRTTGTADAIPTVIDTVTPPNNLQKKSPPDPGYHIVINGDTLYSIAWRYNLNYRDIAKWNKIDSPYTIYSGQTLRITPVTLSAAQQPRSLASVPHTVKKPAKKPAARKKATLPPSPQRKKNTTSGAVIKWAWPTTGTIMKSDGTVASKKGISIAGQYGQIIRAAATGEVVYSDSKLLGYGKLIIIKHNAVYLSAYAHNSRLLVQEGDSVAKGQQISHMGGRADQSLLYFEIRKDGKSVDPLKMLPKNRSTGEIKASL